MPAKPLQWRKPHMIGLHHEPTQMPTPRSGYSLTIVGVNGYLFGGLDACAVPPQASDGFYVVRLSEDVCEWKRFNQEQESDWPLARWRHSATQINSTTILMFGGFHSHDERLNDCWLFDTITLSWSRYEPTVGTEEGNKRKRGGRDIKDVYHLPLQEVKSREIPCPRGGHSSTMVGEHMYLFGGYGGYGYARRELEDLHCLDISTMRWSEITNAKGFPPDKRSGHQACNIQSSLVISGGKNSEVEFRDVHVLDLSLDPPVWTNYYEALPECRWNFAARSFMAMPKWRMFVFGGKGRQNEGYGLASTEEEYLNDVLMVDTQTFQVQQVEVLGDAPPPRADMEMVFDAKHGQMVVFSGYGVEWMNDIYFLDISSMVGPSYSLKDIFPRVGPVTGGTEIDILGLDFPNTHDVTVRFEWEKSKAFMDVAGRFQSQTKLTCVTPDLSTYRGTAVLSQGSCKVRVALDGDSFTLTTADFYFHSVTDASKSVVFGPGVLEYLRDPENNKLAPLQETMFVIQAKDENGKNRTTGGDEYTVNIKLKIIEEGVDEIQFRAIHGVSIEDNEDGTYLVRYTAPEAGEYIVECQFNGTFGGAPGPLRGTPIVVMFDDFAPRANNQFTGKLMLSSLKREVDHLGAFTSSTLEGLLQPISEDDKRVEKGTWSEDREMHALAEVKSLITSVHDNEANTETSMARCKSMVTYMKKIGRNVGPMVGTLKQASNDWKAIFEMMPNLEEKMKPLLKKNGVKIRAQIATYREELHQFKLETELGQGYKEYAVGWASALHMIDTHLKRCEKEQKKCDNMLILANAFNCPREMGETMQVLAESKLILEDYDALWTVDKEVRTLMEMATEMLWSDLDPAGLDGLGASVLKKAKKCPLETANSDAYRGLQQFARNFFVVCPMVASFKKPCFKDRHWKELWMIAIPNDDPPEYIRTNYKYPEQNPEFLIHEFFNFLALHKHVALVEALILKAECEMNHELLVESIEERWANLQFQPIEEEGLDGDKQKTLTKEGQRKARAKAAKSSHLLPILTLSESNFETLRNDQVSLMDILKSSFVRYHGISQTWISRLEAIATVVELGKKNREASHFLYALFTISEEVKRALPKAAARYKGVYDEQKTFYVNMITATSACSACTGWRPKNSPKDGEEGGDMVPVFEKHATILEKCQRDLRIYADAKRCDFPRFFFLSNRELLDVLANGTDPSVVIRHLSKFMLEMDTIYYNPNEEDLASQSKEVPSSASISSAGSTGPVVYGVSTAFVGFGREIVPFATPSGAHEPMKLAGAVEIYLQQLLVGSGELIHSCIDLSVSHFPTSTKLEWLMERQEFLEVPLKPSETANPENIQSIPKHCGQVAVFVSNLFNVKSCEEAMQSFQSGVSNAYQTMRDQHAFDLGEFVKLIRANLSSLDRARVGNELVIDLFWRDAFAMIAKHEITDLSSFVWQSYLKPEYIPSMDEEEENSSSLALMKSDKDSQKSIVRLSAFGVKINYGFMYHSGAHPLPVCTPSTDKTCLALLRALNNVAGSGVAVLGERGSGKSTMVDSVCRTVGRHYLSLGCTSTMLPSLVESIITGCVASGCMLLLHNPEALSETAAAVLAHTLNAVFTAVNISTDEKPAVSLMNSNLTIDRGFTCLVEASIYRSTNGGQAHGGRMPFAGGMGGRGVPDIVRTKFRPVSISPPDIDAIMSIQLMKEGFVNYEVLGPKLRLIIEAFPCVVTTTPPLSLGNGFGSWGLPTLAPFLSNLGMVKRTSPEVTEPRILLEVVKELLLCQLHDKDKLGAIMFLRDMFRFARVDPDDEPQIVRSHRFEEVVHQVSEDLGFWPQDVISENVCTLNEMLEVRAATILCGEAGSGKSTVIKIVEATRNFIKSEQDALIPDEGDEPPVFDAPTKTVVLPVNALTFTDLFGSHSDNSESGSDPGYLSKVLREISMAYKKTKRPTILVLDGDVCASGWGEAFLNLLNCAEGKLEAPMNITFMDKMQLRLPPTLRVVFEVSQMRSMTPAMVSRASLMHLEDKDGYLWRCVMARWIASRPDESYGDAVKDWLSDMFELYVPPCLRWLKKHKGAHCPEPVNLVTTCFRYLGGFLDEFPSFTGKRTHVELAFIFCAAWAFGGHIPRVGGDEVEKGAPKKVIQASGYTAQAFSDWWRNEFKGVPFPRGGSIFDWWLDPTSASFTLFSKSHAMMDGITYLKENFDPLNRTFSTASEVVVPTSDGVAVSLWLRRLMRSGFPALVMGPSGSGKRTCIDKAIKDLEPIYQAPPKSASNAAVAEHKRRCLTPVVQSNMLTMRAGSDPQVLQFMIRSVLFSNGHGIIGPGSGYKQTVIFIEDVSAATCASSAVMRRLTESKKMYGASPQLSTISLENVSIVASSSLRARVHKDRGETEGEMDRMLRHFSVIWKGAPGPSDITFIARTLLEINFTSQTSFPRALKDASKQLAASMSAVHMEMVHKFRASPAKPFLNFNMRHIQRILDGGVMRVDPDTVFSLESLVVVWLHESLRTYADSLPSQADADIVEKILLARTSLSFGMVDTTKYFPLKRAQEPLLWSTFADRSKDLQEKAPRYKPIPVSLDVTRQSLSELLGFYHLSDSAEAARRSSIDDRKLPTDFDMTRPPLPISSLFDQVILLLLRLIRLLGCKAATHVTLVGKPGSGRKSLLKFAAYIANLEVRSLTGDRFVDVLKQTLERMATTRDPLGEVDEEDGAPPSQAGVVDDVKDVNDENDDEDDAEDDGDAPLSIPVYPMSKAVLLMAVDEADSKLNDTHFHMLCSLIKGNIPDGLFTVDEKARLCLALRPSVLADRRTQIGAVIRGDVLVGLTEVSAAELCWKEFIRRVMKRLRVAVVLNPGADFIPDKHRHYAEGTDMMDSSGEGGGVSIARHSMEFDLHHVGSYQFRSRMSMHAELSRICSVEWVLDYPSRDVILSILNNYFDDLYIGDLNEKRAVAKFFAYAFISANDLILKSPQHGLLPRVFGLDCLHAMVLSLQKVFMTKREEIDDYVWKMEKGLAVMAEATSDGEKLKSAVTELQLAATEKQEEYEKLNELFISEGARVDREIEKVIDFEGYVAKIWDDAENEREKIIGILNQCIPFLESMQAQVESIDRADIGQLAKLNKLPHGVVDDVFGGLVTLFAAINENIPLTKLGKVDERTRSWASARETLLGNINSFIDSLRNFKLLVDSGEVPEQNFKDIRRFLVLEHFQRPNDFIEPHSSVAASLATWTCDVVKYSDIIQSVEPYRQVMQKFILQHQNANKRLLIAKEALEQQKLRLAKLGRDAEVVKGQWKRAVEEAKRGELRLDLADKLVNILRNEGDVWVKKISNLEDRRNGLLGDAAYCATMVHIASAFDPTTRRSLTKTWVPHLQTCLLGRPLPMSSQVENISDIALSYSTPLQWAAGRGESIFSGSPGRSMLNIEDRDVLTGATAAWITHRVPVLIDPEKRMMSWLVTTLYSEQMEVWEAKKKVIAEKHQTLMRRGASRGKQSRPGSKEGSRPVSRDGGRNSTSNNGGDNLPAMKSVPRPQPPLIVRVSSYQVSKSDGVVSSMNSVESLKKEGIDDEEEAKHKVMKAVLKAVRSAAVTGRPVVLSVEDGDDIDWHELVPFLSQRKFSKIRLEEADNTSQQDEYDDVDDEKGNIMEAMEEAMEDMPKIESEPVIEEMKDPIATEVPANGDKSMQAVTAPVVEEVAPSPVKKAVKPKLDHYLSLTDDDMEVALYSPDNFWIGIHTTSPTLDSLSARIQAGCTLVHFGATSSLVRESVSDVIMSSIHPPLFARLCEVITSTAAKELAVQAYEGRLLDQLLIEEAPEEEEDEEVQAITEVQAPTMKDEDSVQEKEEEEETEEQKIAKQKAKKLAEQAEIERLEQLALRREKKKVPITENKGLIKTIQGTKKGELTARQALEDTIAEHDLIKAAVFLYSPLITRSAHMFHLIASLESMKYNGIKSNNGMDGDIRNDDATQKSLATPLYTYSLSEHLIVIATALQQAKKFLDQSATRSKKKKKKKEKEPNDDDGSSRDKVSDAELKREQMLDLLMSGDSSVNLTFDVFQVRLKRYLEAATTMLMESVNNRCEQVDLVAVRAAIYLPILIPPPPPKQEVEHQTKAKSKEDGNSRRRRGNRRNKEKEGVKEESITEIAVPKGTESAVLEVVTREHKSFEELEAMEFEINRLGLEEIARLGYCGNAMLPAIEVELLCTCKEAENAEPMDEALSSLLTERQWKQLAHLEHELVKDKSSNTANSLVAHTPFSHLKTQFGEYTTEWRKWMHSTSPESSLMPGPMSECTDFQRILVVAILRRDRVSLALNHFLETQASKIGHKIMLPRQRPAFPQLVASLIRDKAALNLNESANNSAPKPLELDKEGVEGSDQDNLTPPASPWISFEIAKRASTLPIRPILALYSDGESLLELRKLLIDFKKGGLKSEKMNELWYHGNISTEISVLAAIKSAAKGANRIMCHCLASCSASFVRGLVGCFDAAKPTFQIIITCPLAKVNCLPTFFMKQCVRMVDDEPNRNFKSLVRRQWRRIPAEFLDTATTKPLELRALTFASVCLHALLTARHRFQHRGWHQGSIGLGLGYSGGFGGNDADALLVMDNALKLVQGDALNWGSIRAAVFYNLFGGMYRSDSQDEKALHAHVASMFRPELIGRHFVSPGGQLLTLPDPNDAVGHADYFEHIDKVMSLGLPLTSGDGETDASPILFGLDDKCEVALLSGEGPNGTERVMDNLAASLDRLFKSNKTELTPKDEADLLEKTIVPPGHLAMTWIKTVVEKCSEMPPNIDLTALMDRAMTQLAKPHAPGIMLCFNECSRFNLVASRVRADLAVIRAVLVGTQETDSATEEQIRGLLSESTVPAAWQRLAWSLPVGLNVGMTAPDWLEKLSASGRQLRPWQADLAIPKVVKWSLLFSPWALPIALKQCAIRSFQKKHEGRSDPIPSIEELTTELVFTTLHDVNRIPADTDKRPSVGSCFVSGLMLEGAVWPEVSDIMATPGAATHYVGGVEGVNGGGWLEPKAGNSNSFDSFDLPRFQTLPIALLQCNRVPEPAVQLPVPSNDQVSSPAPLEDTVDQEAVAEMALQAASHEWRVEAVAEIEQAIESPTHTLSRNSNDNLKLGNSDAIETVDQSQSAPIDSSVRELPIMRDIQVPLFCCGDRTVPLLKASFPAAMRKGAAPWPLANPGLFLQPN